MRHLSESALALLAGGDLGWLAGKRAAWHAGRCERCRAEVDRFRAAREVSTDLAELPPDLSWNRMEAEMKANIRLGLAAGECVGGAEEAPASRWSPRAALAYASIAAVIGCGVWLQRPAPVGEPLAEGEIRLAATQNGIELQEGRRALSLRHARVRDVNDVMVTVSAQGSVRARYVDSETGQVTINNVYAQ